MSDKRSGSDPGFLISPEDEAFLRLVEDSYEAAGRPTDPTEADRVWGKLEPRLGPKKVAQPRRKWAYIASAFAVAAALVLFVNLRQEEAPGSLQTRGGASGFAATLKVYESEGHHVRVKVLAEADGHVALFRQQGDTAPIFVANLVYKKGQGETLMLEEESQPGARYCIIGGKDQESLKHLVELIPDLWAYLPESSCYSVR